MKMKGWPHMRLPLQIGLTVLALAGVADAQAQMRFQAMDSDRDGIVDNEDAQITQRFRGYDMNSDARVAASEWPGEQRLFTRLDTNRDRFLTMQEYTLGAGFRLDAQGGPAFRFANVDTNRDGWITKNEWNMGVTAFNRLDVNR